MRRSGYKSETLELRVLIRSFRLSKSRRGGIGRRAGLKIQWPQGRVGSSPSAGRFSEVERSTFEPVISICVRPANSKDTSRLRIKPTARQAAPLGATTFVFGHRIISLAFVE